jgi:UDP-N-acetylmuramoylalanine--D-glutamate ligase
MDFSDVTGIRVLIMGLGAHGGGAASARFFAERGARVAVTDLRSREDLESSISSLYDLPITFVLGEHRESDFIESELVIKNPAVPRSSEFLKLAARIETDISVFLSLCPGDVVAVTGTKGKSTTASILHHILTSAHRNSWLGGNITISPLSFVTRLDSDSVTVLELSSFQLGDLQMTESFKAGRCRTFSAVAITNLLPDHQDYYDSMESYAADKATIFSRPTPNMPVVLSADDPFSRAFDPPKNADTVRVHRSVGDGLAATDERASAMVATEHDLLPPEWNQTSAHIRTSAFFAALMALRLTVGTEQIRSSVADFPGVPHRLEHVITYNGVLFVNDSAATIQESCRAAVESFDCPVHLIAGGSDKGLPVDLFPRIAATVASIHLLQGSGTNRILSELTKHGLPFSEPHQNLETAVLSALEQADSGDVVLLSPGCASFGMFRNEFDRGDQFRRLVQELAKR